jgi:hypothetical protein
MTDRFEVYPQSNVAGSLAEANAWANSGGAGFVSEVHLQGRTSPNPRCNVPFCEPYFGKTFADFISRYRAIGLAVEAVIDERRRELNAAAPAAIPTSGGRLAVLEPEGCFRDGVSQFNSEGFFDTNDVPPPNCWVGYIIDKECLKYRLAGEPSIVEQEHYLVFYVPPKWLNLAGKGIYVNPTNCINWCDDEFLRLRPAIRYFVSLMQVADS